MGEILSALLVSGHHLTLVSPAGALVTLAIHPSAWTGGDVDV
jgi:hypothetical protein